MTVASANGYIALLNEPNAQVQVRALQALLSMVDTNWHEMVQSLPQLSEMATPLAQSNKYGEHQQAAALLCSRLCFHLGELDRSVEFALRAGDLFEQDCLNQNNNNNTNTNNNNDYGNVILAKAVDNYIAAKKGNNNVSVEPLLEGLVERLIKRCLEQGEYLQVIGIALECRRLDILEATVKAPSLEDERLSLVYYIVDVSVKMPADFQHALLSLCVSVLRQCATPDHVTIADCLVMLGDSASVITLLRQLLTDVQLSVALQICFNINDNADQQFKSAVMDALKDVKVFHDAVSGLAANQLRLHFLSRSVASDLVILERTRTMFNPGNTMFHTAVSLSNALMHAGTTNDEFVRKNMDWLAMASNWTKYTAIASLGSVYRGHREQSRHLLSQYLPKEGVVGSEYSEGGALFALGLIHSGFQDQWVCDYLLGSLREARGDVQKHGCCVGLGAAGFATKHQDLLDECKSVLFEDNAVSGEGAAVAVGLLMFGSANVDLVEELLAYAKETKHDKIVRAIAVSVAMILYNSQSLAMPIVQRLLGEQDGWMRFCAMWTVSLAYAGTGDRSALSVLLKTAVTDSDGDVRRVAVIGQSFVLINHQTELPEMTRLMLESYNPNLRFGALLSLGIGFAGTGNVQALDMIDALMRTDKVDYVRQAAMMAAAMVLMQQPADRQSPLRSHLERIISTKHEEALAKFGAVLAQGILDCGGRNQVLSLCSPSGQLRPLAVAGLAMFCQFWFWYPNVTFLSLSLTPSGLVGVTSSDQVPVMAVTCHARHSQYSYPQPVKGDKEIAPVKLVTAVLSTADAPIAAADAADTNMSAVESEKVNEKRVEIEADSFAVANMSRVTADQAKHLRFDGRFRPVSRFHPRTVTVLVDSTPAEPCDFVNIDAVDDAVVDVVGGGDGEGDGEKGKEKEKEKEKEETA